MPSIHPHSMTAAQWDEIVHQSVLDGLKSSGATALLLGSGAVALHQYSPTFRNRLGVSGKVATVFIPTAFMFWLSSQRTVARARDDPEAFRRQLEARKMSMPTIPKWMPTMGNGLPPHHALANFVHDRPFTFIAVGGSTALSGIFAMEAIMHPTMKLSSRVMHTRVYAQGIAVTLLCGTMLFHEHMKHAGKYEPAVPVPVPAAQEGEGASGEMVTARPRRWDMYAPLLYAPLLPLIRIGLRGRTSQANIDRVFLGAVFTALAHAGYIMFSDSSV